MFIVEAVTSGIGPKDAAGAQVASLNQRKATDPLVFYDAIVNEATGDVILDFLISAAGRMASSSSNGTATAMRRIRVQSRASCSTPSADAPMATTPRPSSPR